MAKKFCGKTILITGASSGIGAALAIEFAKEDAQVVLASRKKEWLEKIAEKIAAFQGKSLVVECDVTKPDTLQNAVKKTIETFQKIDMVIANAGFGVSGLFQDLSVEDFRRQFETNFFGMLHTIYATLPYLKESRGRLVLMGSVAGRLGAPTSSPYTASKFAVNGLAECLYYELQEVGISVSWINPGFVESNIARVDNQGNFHENRRDPRPALLMMPVQKAARKMVRALYWGKSEIIITTHGKILVALTRWFPSLFRWVIRLLARGRMKFFQKRKRSEES